MAYITVYYVLMPPVNVTANRASRATAVNALSTLAPREWTLAGSSDIRRSRKYLFLRRLRTVLSYVQPFTTAHFRNVRATKKEKMKNEQLRGLNAAAGKAFGLLAILAASVPMNAQVI